MTFYICACICNCFHSKLLLHCRQLVQFVVQKCFGAKDGNARGFRLRCRNRENAFSNSAAQTEAQSERVAASTDTEDLRVPDLR